MHCADLTFACNDLGLACRAYLSGSWLRIQEPKIGALWCSGLLILLTSAHACAEVKALHRFVQFLDFRDFCSF